MEKRNQTSSGNKRACKLIEAAKKTVGVREGLKSAENELSMLLEEYELLQRQYDKTMALVEEQFQA